MWQGWHDENQKNMRLERELKNLTTLFRRVVEERDSLKIERDGLKEYHFLGIFYERYFYVS